MDNRPIGFLDSGVGGLTVVKELRRQLPHEEVIYIGDSARAPYGPRAAEEIRQYTWELVRFLQEKNVKMIGLSELKKVRKHMDNTSSEPTPTNTWSFPTP